MGLGLEGMLVAVVIEKGLSKGYVLKRKSLLSNCCIEFY
jgi:hypothetical protein